MSKASKQSGTRESRWTTSPEGAGLKRKPLSGYVLLSGGLFLIAAVVCVCVFPLVQNGRVNANQKSTSNLAALAFAETAPPRHEVTQENRALSGRSEVGQVPPHTEAERELEKMLRGKDEDIDLAQANWLIAADIPQFRDMTREAYFAQLDAMTEQVRKDMAMMQKSGWRGADPTDPASHCRAFCSAMIRLRFAYAEEFRQEQLTPALMKTMYLDANNTFLTGLVRTRRGSCVSMPLIYLVIGQRLGLPVHLVAIGKHYFIRWEDPRYRMNIETTIVDKVSVTPDDSVYLEIEGMARDQLSGSDLRNLTHREVVGNLFFTRSCYWGVKGANFQNQRCLDLVRARHLSPDDPAIKAVHQAVLNHYGIKPEYTSNNINVGSKE